MCTAGANQDPYSAWFPGEGAPAERDRGDGGQKVSGQGRAEEGSGGGVMRTRPEGVEYLLARRMQASGGRRRREPLPACAGYFRAQVGKEGMAAAERAGSAGLKEQGGDAEVEACGFLALEEDICRDWSCSVGEIGNGAACGEPAVSSCESKAPAIEAASREHGGASNIAAGQCWMNRGEYAVSESRVEVVTISCDDDACQCLDCQPCSSACCQGSPANIRYNFIRLFPAASPSRGHNLDR